MESTTLSPAPARHPCIGSSRTRASDAMTLLGILAIGLLFRSYDLDKRSVWFDEAFSCRLIEFPWRELAGRVAQDNHPPLYFFLVKLWATCFGTSTFVLRLLSVLFGLLTIAGMYLFASEAYGDGRRGGTDATRGRNSFRLLVAAFVALSVFHIRWSWEIRMYTLGTALAAFSSWAMFKALHAGTRPLRYWLLYSVFALLFAYTHYYALFTIAGQSLFVAGYGLARLRRPDGVFLPGRQFACAGLAALILVAGCLPWVPFFLQQRLQVQDDYWIAPVTAWKIAHAGYMMFVEPENASISPASSVACSVACAAILLALCWRPRHVDMYVVVAALVPLVCSIGVSVFDTKIFHLRYLLFAHLFLLAALALLLARLPSGAIRGLVYAQVLLNFIAADVAFWNKLDVAHKPGARAAIAYLTQHRRPDENVIVCSPLLYFSILHHAPNRTGLSVYSNGRGIVHYEGAAVMRPEDLMLDEQLKALAARRVWVLDMTGWGTREVPVPAHWSLVDEHRYPEVLGVQGEIIVREFEIVSRPTSRS